MLLEQFSKENNKYEFFGDLYEAFYNDDGSFYYELNDSDFFELGLLIENSDIIYGEDVYFIKRNGVKLSDCLVID